MKLARIFVSSVFGGRTEDRLRIADAARLMGFEVSLTEALIAGDTTVQQVIERELLNCDTYVGLFGQRRGTLLQSTGTPEADWESITEWEFRRATELGIPRLALYDGDSTPPAKVQELVSAFGSGVYPVVFQGERGLRHAVTSALAWRRPRVVLNLWRDPALPEGQVWAQARLGWLRPALNLEDPPATAVDVRLDRESAALFDLFLGADQPGRVLNEAGLKVLGAKLLGLLPESIQALLDRALAISKQRSGFTLPLVIRTDLPEALALPWELLHLPACAQPVRQGQLEIVRQVHSSGPDDDARQDPLPKREDAEFALLGFVADPVEDQQAGIRMGAQGGFGPAHNLFVEREQEQLYQALEPILARGPGGEAPRGRVVLTDTGDVEELRQALAREDRPGILHLGCHGGPVTRQGPIEAQPTPAQTTGAQATEGQSDPAHIPPAADPLGSSWAQAKAPRAAALFLEDQEGHRRPVFAEELGAWTNQQGRALELAVLSACFTSSSWAVEAQRHGRRAPLSSGGLELLKTTGSLTEGLIAHGIPRVLGMQTSVSDSGASRFARAFYGSLAQGRDLTQALAQGRRALTPPSNTDHEWAIPTLWVKSDFQPLAAPQGDQDPNQAGVARPQTPFELAGVAYLREGYVERREFTRRARRAWHEARLLAIHGIGGIGKSTYAARLLQRREQQGWRVIILTPGKLLPAQLLDDVAKHFDVQRQSGMPEQQANALFESQLAEQLAQQPTAILLDNFEDNTDESGAVDEALSRAIARLAGLLERPTAADTRPGNAGAGLPNAPLPAGRIVLTTRYAPTWHLGVRIQSQNLPLGELSQAEARKLKLERPGLRSLVRPTDGVQGPAAAALDQHRWEQILATFGGHPKALTLLADHLAADTDAPLTLIDQISGAVTAIDAQLQDQNQRHAQGRALLVNHLLAGVPAEHLPSLQRLALAIDPLPSEPTDEALRLLTEAQVQNPAASIHWLKRRGLLAPSLSSQTGRAGLLVHRLITTALARSSSPTLPALPTTDAQAFHTALATYYRTRQGPLNDFALAAHHHAQAGDRPAAFDAYQAWAIQLRKRDAYRATIEVAQRSTAALGPPMSPAEVIAWGGAQLQAFDGFEGLGQPEACDQVLTAIQAAIPAGPPPEFQDLAAGCAVKVADLESRRGNPSAALSALEFAAATFKATGNSRSRAIALGEIARLKAQAGDVQGALALHKEELDVYEQLKDVRSRAVTLNDIARLKAQASDIQGALKDFNAALAIVQDIGEVKGRAVTLGEIARLKAQAGDVRGALALHKEELEVYQQLGDVRERAVTLGDIARLKAQAGDVQGAIEMNRERLGVAKSMNDLDSVAATQFDLARYELVAEQPQQVLERLGESFRIFLQIGRVDGIYAVGEMLGTILVQIGHPEARAVLELARGAAGTLGWQQKVAELDALIAKCPPGE